MTLGIAQRLVLNDFDQVPIVEAGAADSVLINAEAEAADQVERAQGRRAEACDIARVRGNFRFDQNNVKRARDRARA